MNDNKFRIEGGVPWVGDRSFPWTAGVRSDEYQFSAGDWYWHRGFHLKLDTSPKG